MTTTEPGTVADTTRQDAPAETAPVRPHRYHGRHRRGTRGTRSFAASQCVARG